MEKQLIYYSTSNFKHNLLLEPVQESTTAMDLSTGSTVTTAAAIDFSTGSTVTTAAMDLSSDSARTRPDRNDMNQSGKNPIVIVVASVCGGITGILIIVILCICIVCIIKRIQVHVHYDGGNSDSRHQENAPHSSGTPLEIPSKGNSMQYNLAYESQDQIHESGTLEIGSPGDYQKMSSYIAFRHGNPSRRQGEGTCAQQALPMEYIMPVQHGPSNTCTGEYYDDVHSYEYIQ